MSYEAFLTDEVTRRLCCFPCEIPVMQLPLIICAIFSILGGIIIDQWIGLGLGYLCVYFLYNFFYSRGLC